MLNFDSVTVRYRVDAEPAVNELDLGIGAGERVALIGPSGAGKTTVLALASGLVVPTSGNVSVFGVDSTELGARSRRATRARIGIIQQDFALVGPLRVAQNVAAGRLGEKSFRAVVATLFRPSDVEGITKALDRVGIADRIFDRADQLSGGQQQRTAIARALYQSPDLLLADEPVSALDPARSDAVLDELMVPNESRSVLSSLHDAPLALAHSDRVVALRDGRVEFDRPPSEVTERMLTELYKLDNTKIS